MASDTNGNGLGTHAPSLLDLATNIMRQTAGITAYLTANKYIEPTFDSNSSVPPETLEYLALHSSLISSLEDLQRLVDGPHRSLRTFVCQGTDLAAFQVGFDFGFFGLVPVDGEIEINDLAQKAGMDADRAARCMRMMITHRVFQEKRPGWFSHSAASAILNRDEELHCAGDYILDEMWKAATATSECIKASPHESDSVHSPFNTRLGSPMFDYYAKHPEYAARFAKAMAGVTRVDRQIGELRDGYVWDQLKGTVVDVGGGSGHISISLAQSFPNLDFLVQDGSTDMLAQGQAILAQRDSNLKERIVYEQHNFFNPQPARPVGAFFIRQCTHNWCDRDVITILRGFIPGLEVSRPGTPLLINDTILPEPGTRPVHEERSLRQMDMLMLVGLGAKQRTKREFEVLLNETDKRYEIHKVHAEGSMGLLEVHLNLDLGRD